MSDIEHPLVQLLPFSALHWSEHWFSANMQDRQTVNNGVANLKAVGRPCMKICSIQLENCMKTQKILENMLEVQRALELTLHDDDLLHLRTKLELVEASEAEDTTCTHSAHTSTSTSTTPTPSRSQNSAEGSSYFHELDFNVVTGSIKKPPVSSTSVRQARRDQSLRTSYPNAQVLHERTECTLLTNVLGHAGTPTRKRNLLRVQQWHRSSQRRTTRSPRPLPLCQTIHQGALTDPRCGHGKGATTLQIELMKVLRRRANTDFSSEDRSYAWGVTEVTPLHLGEGPAQEFENRRRDLKVTPTVAWHGTKSHNYESIARHGLVIPGQRRHGGYGKPKIPVAHGQFHGRGIYVAKQPSLAQSFSTDSTLLMCAVLDDSKPLTNPYKVGVRQFYSCYRESDNIKHVGDAIVVQHESHVLPIYTVTLGDISNLPAEIVLNPNSNPSIFFQRDAMAAHVMQTFGRNGSGLSQLEMLYISHTKRRQQRERHKQRQYKLAIYGVAAGERDDLAFPTASAETTDAEEACWVKRLDRRAKQKGRQQRQAQKAAARAVCREDGRYHTNAVALVAKADRILRQQGDVSSLPAHARERMVRKLKRKQQNKNIKHKKPHKKR